MNICYFIRSLRLETLAHLRVFVFGVACGVAVFAPFAQGNPHQSPIAQPAVVHQKNCDDLWNTPYSELTDSEQEARYQCDMDEVAAQYWSNQAQEAMQQEMQP